jgi:diguanylate cyclase (GGDEF)-like protein/PAS domain S-box-containing protein
MSASRHPNTPTFRFPYGGALLRNVVENAAVPTFLVEMDGHLFYANRAFGELLGYTPDEIIKLGISEIVHPDDATFARQQTAALAGGKISSYRAERRYLGKDGTIVWVLASAAALIDNGTGKIRYITVQAIDIGRQKRAEAELAETYRRHLAALEKAHEATEAAHQLAQSLARHDVLTGLPNRRVFTEAMESADVAHKRSAAPYAILIVDLDRFKPVNDIHGHHIGDDVLREISARIIAVVRKGDALARLGGDEFGIIQHCVKPGEDPAAAAVMLADRIIKAVGRPIAIGDRRVEVGASIGIAICPTDGADSETLLRSADMAMYRAKDDGRGTYRFFEQGMDVALRLRMALEADVRRAIVNHEIQPYYQPLMLLAENRLVGFEVLARWQHPTRGDVPPASFIPIAEKLDLIGELTYTLLQRACLDALHWSPEITIALNVSPRHLGDPLLPVKLLAILSETGFPPTRLEIEVTESALVSDLPSARATLVALQDIGIKISLDDFGMGYSSLYNLRELHFDKIKIDRSFVLSMGTDAESAKIVHSVINLAKSLGLPTIAEGIEHVAAMNQIVQSGGEFGQGYYFSKAMPAAEAERLVTDAHGGVRQKA